MESCCPYAIKIFPSASSDVERQRAFLETVQNVQAQFVNRAIVEQLGTFWVATKDVNDATMFKWRKKKLPVLMGSMPICSP
jgi:hypothetical protein